MGKKDPLLGDFPHQSKKFDNLDPLFSSFKESAFQEKNDHEKSNSVSNALCELIQKSEGPTFLLEAAVDFITRINTEKVLASYTFSSFELWLNQFSHLSAEEDYELRGKIVGKWIPRDNYQAYFPIGMGKSYEGTHFVTAHNSPDLDTTVASFWGWVDAFAARVGRGLHIWNVPGGAPHTQVEIGVLFHDLFGEGVFACLAETRLSLTLNSLDLMTQSGMSQKRPNDPALSFEHDRQRNAVVIVDNSGFYLGDWRTIDLEGVRGVVMALNNCLMWLEAHLHIRLISCFTEQSLTLDHISSVIQEILKIKINECQPARELPPQQLQFVNDYLVKVLKVEQGIETTFEEFALEMEKIDIVNFTQIISWMKSLVKSELFDASGMLTENRPLIFSQLEVLVKMLSDALNNIRHYVDRIEIAFRIKTDVFGFTPQYLSHRTDIEEIRSKIGSYSYMTVNHTDLEGRQIPIGVVHATDLQKDTLGTVTLRDFCNREEMKIPSYLQVISVIDHHKSALQTETPPTAIISDAQSSNAIVAQMAFNINDQYGLSGMTEEMIDQQIKEQERDLTTLHNLRIYKRLLQKKIVLKTEHNHYVDPIRESVEYLHFVYAILDDTDLLTKVSRIDIECIASLLNRLKSLMVKRECEIVNFDDIKEDEDFTEKAAKRLLQNDDFYSLYSKVYLHKEEGVAENFKKCLKREPSNIFTDTKILGYCNRVGQTKIFASNTALFQKHAMELRKRWVEKALSIYANNREIMLHIHMVTTIASAEELFKGSKIDYEHQDEMWFWIPPTDLALQKLKLFLNGFKSSSAVGKLAFEVEFLGDNARELSQAFKESFLPIKHHLPKKPGELPIAILRYNAGGLNSRKAMIAPYLPRLVGK
ncbi:MAG: hypothetical protein K1060chlam2_00983 [Chlamydiae bacterium]|nr:hypothetical protein [Chlamydiota bacterium]